MQLDQIAAVVRPRKSWEAIDLGFQMARAWWAPMLRAWMMLVAPFVLLLVVVLRDHPFLAIFVVWWLKPLYDRVPLFVLSRALFGSVPRVREVWRQMPRLSFFQSMATLTLFRLDPLRSFVLPVGRLEGLRGAEYRERVGVLKHFSDEAQAASWLTFACLIFEVAMTLSWVALLDLMRPEEIGDSLWNVFSLLGQPEQAWVYFLVMTLSFLAVTMIEPFYVAGGFALYINRRTQLEGWDVELAFRRLAERLRAGEPPRSSQGRSAVIHGVVVGLVISIWGAAEVLARDPPGGAEIDPQKAMEEVLSDADFGERRRVTRWRPRWQPEGGESADVSSLVERIALLVGHLAVVFRIVAWAAFFIVVLFLVRAARRRFGSWDGLDPPAAPAEGNSAAIVIAGLDISSKALPDDIVKAALAEWTTGRPEAALSLLYRGFLARLVDQRQLPARESWTEEDCLRHLEASPPQLLSPRTSADVVEYFSRLTATWQRTAYAHLPPSDEEIHQLAGAWSRYFPMEQP